MLNSASRSRSAVGRIACDFGAASVRPRKPAADDAHQRSRRPLYGRRPPRCRARRLPVAVERRVRPSPRPRSAQSSSAASDVRAAGFRRDPAHRAGRRLRRGAVAARASGSGWRSHLGVTDAALRRLRPARPAAPEKSAPATRGDALAELLAQRARLDLLDRAFRQVAELERPERHADQPVHRQPEMAQHVAHLAVLALAHREREPDIGALLAVERRLDRAVADAVDRDAVAQRVELRLRDLAVRAHAIAPQPAGRRQFQHAREPAVIGQQQQALGVEVEPADADQRGRSFGSAPKMVGRPCGSAWVVTSPRGL